MPPRFALPALLLAALALLAPGATASNEVCLRGEVPTVCAIDGDNDGVPEDVVVRLPAELANDLGMVQVLPVVRLAGDQDRDHLPEVVAADVLARAQALDRHPRLRLLATALDGASTAGLDAGTGLADARAAVDADARGAGTAMGLDALGRPAGAAEARAAPRDVDGDGLHDHAEAGAAARLPWGEDLHAGVGTP